MNKGRAKSTSQRQLRVAEEVRHVLAHVIGRDELHDPALAGVPITVSEVRISPDLGTRPLFVSPLGGGDAGPLVSSVACGAVSAPTYCPGNGPSDMSRRSHSRPTRRLTKLSESRSCLTHRRVKGTPDRMGRRRKGRPIHGWLVIDKEPGMTSSNVVNKVRHILNAQKVGHGGTLDPMATGILPLAFGEATKTVSYIMDGTKEYSFSARWGESRDTDDAEVM